MNIVQVNVPYAPGMVKLVFTSSLRINAVFDDRRLLRDDKE